MSLNTPSPILTSYKTHGNNQEQEVKPVAQRY